MGGLAATEPDFDFDFVTLFEEPSRCAHTHLQVMIVGTRAKPHFFDLRNVLVLLGVSLTLVLLEFEFPQIGNATDWRIGGRRDFDQVQSGFLGAMNSIFEWHDPDLLTVSIEDSYLGGSDLVIGPGTGRRRRPGNKWWTGNRRFSFSGSTEVVL
jgi:hypothetical protein